MEILEKLGTGKYLKKDKNISMFAPNGCPDCKNGYSGRIGIYELMHITNKIRSLIKERSAASEVMEAALKGGMIPLRQDGLLKVANGVTTIEEVLSVTQEVEEI
jgi:type II secretory ATPase GspE/PulE/Tfp pilus assembly ATPase PilB-like protein